MSRCVIYIYFRVARENEPAAVKAVREMQSSWAGECSAELLRRTDEPGDVVTLMEVYRGVTAEQRQRIEHEAASRLATWLIGARHTEVFEVLDSPLLAALAAPRGGAQPPWERPGGR
jgi:hypothetical protein